MSTPLLRTKEQLFRKSNPVSSKKKGDDIEHEKVKMDISNSLQVKKEMGREEKGKRWALGTAFDLSAIIHVAMIGIKMLATPNSGKKEKFICPKSTASVRPSSRS